VWLLVAVLVAATAFGLWRHWRDGRMSDRVPGAVAEDAPEAHVLTPDARHHGGEVLTAAQLGEELGEQATFVQFSSAFCQPCRATRLLLTDMAGRVPGVKHVEVDAESHMDLVRHLGVRRTPTVFLLDGHGAIRKRAVGLPRKSEVVAALAAVV
jgi:thiol-disulfide isomerase/thioredoxin